MSGLYVFRAQLVIGLRIFYYAKKTEGGKMKRETARCHQICFTGHRPERMGLPEKKVKALLRPIIIQTISEGYSTFITGMARGFDMWAADIVLEAKKHNPNIYLVCVPPIPDFEKRWTLKDQNHYRKLLRNADTVKVVSAHYSKTCFQIRNMYMVDHSSKVIAAYNGTGGGTLNTINYAKRKGIEVINILEKEI